MSGNLKDFVVKIIRCCHYESIPLGLILLELQAQGNIPKSKSLEEILKSSCKMEAKLIGYDETPIDVVASDVVGFKKLVQEPSSSNINSKVHSISEVSNSNSSCIKRVRQPSSSLGAVKMDPSDSSDNHSSDSNSETRGTVDAYCTSRVSRAFLTFAHCKKISRWATQINSKISFV